MRSMDIFLSNTFKALEFNVTRFQSEQTYYLHVTTTANYVYKLAIFFFINY